MLPFNKSRIFVNEKIRCPWPGNMPIYIDYHDNEWGRPVHDDVKLFEMLILEGMQATGMVNDHLTECFVYDEISRRRYL